MKTLITILFFLVTSLTFSQIKIKTPDLEKKAKEKLEKTKKNKEKDVEDKKKDKVEEVEEKTDLDKKATEVSGNNENEVKETKKTKVQYPKVTEPTLLFSSDAEFTNQITEIVPGESDVFAHFIFPGESVNDYLVNKLQRTYQDLHTLVTLSLFDSAGNPIKVNGIVYKASDEEIRFDETKEINAVVLKMFSSNAIEFEKSFIEKFATVINDRKSQISTTPGMKSGINKVNIIVELGTYSDSQGLRDAVTFLKSSFNMNIKDENRGKIKRYTLTERDFKTVEDDGFSGQVHEKNQDKIVFSKVPIAPNEDDLSKIATSFKLTDDIFASICFAKSYKNKFAVYGGSDQCNNTQEVRTYLIVDGKEYINVPLAGDISANARTFFRMVLQDKNNLAKDFSDVLYCGKGLAYVISQLEPGKHNIKFEMRTTKSLWEQLESGRPLLLASGEFTVEFTAAERDAFAKNVGQQFEFNEKVTSDASITALAKKGSPGALAYKIGDMIVQKNYAGITTHREGYMNAITKNNNGDYVLSTYKTKQMFVGGKWEAKITVEYLNDYYYNVPTQNFK